MTFDLMAERVYLDVAVAKGLQATTGIDVEKYLIDRLTAEVKSKGFEPLIDTFKVCWHADVSPLWIIDGSQDLARVQCMAVRVCTDLKDDE